MAEPLRVIDFGCCPPLRSQTLWHAIGYGVSAGAPATLSFVRPAAPYVCVGYHRRIDEVDRDYCRANGLPVLRRMVGGGPVYLDADQLLFQICLPAGAVSPVRPQALRRLLEPAVAAFHAVGAPAVLDADSEICLGEAKVCGHGAGQIGGAVVVCGNLIEHFDHEQATRVLALADPAQRDLTLALMRRFVAATPVDPVAFQAAAVAAYAAGLGLTARPGELGDVEHAALAALDERFVRDSWLAGPYRPVPRSDAGPVARQVKVRAGVWTFGATHEGAQVAAAVAQGTVLEARLRDPGLDGLAGQAERALVGIPLRSVGRVLAGFGDAGRRLAAAFAAADPGRL
ncbi:MAG: biotin/lipoate A/B protein ligase family protein [Acidimicrobiales bacterium]